MSQPSQPLVSDPSHKARQSRLQFSPSYALVGVYRLSRDPNLYKPIWDKVRHGARRGALVGLGWVCSHPLELSIFVKDSLVRLS